MTAFYYFTTWLDDDNDELLCGDVFIADSLDHEEVRKKFNIGRLEELHGVFLSEEEAENKRRKLMRGY
ncbi:MAG TPA: hypothetical protein PLR11_01840 [Candidatus Paceibacterota bacterium]|nr:hypothetical protein [Candidatus Paceibacterota bacterium]